jgi:hypothetical protein
VGNFSFVNIFEFLIQVKFVLQITSWKFNYLHRSADIFFVPVNNNKRVIEPDDSWAKVGFGLDPE